MAGQKYYYYFFILVLLFIRGSYGQCENNIVNKDLPTDYTYIKSVENFYKVYNNATTWSKANRTCEEDGATLFYPRDAAEFHALASYAKQAEYAWYENYSGDYGIWVGISSLFTEDFFTVDEFPIAVVYEKWDKNEPNGAGTEKCLAMRGTGTYSDWPCSHMKPFICKKTLGSVLLNITCNEVKLSVRNDRVADPVTLSSVPSKPLHDAGYPWSTLLIFTTNEKDRVVYPSAYLTLPLGPSTYPKAGSTAT